ncbi:MAG: hypothetical protein HYV07_33690 [Deltaproteobacteria bacterium]|nr:hypothetical protein [Deltaproteobacteria bacterium]
MDRRVAFASICSLSVLVSGCAGCDGEGEAPPSEGVPTTIVAARVVLPADSSLSFDRVRAATSFGTAPVSSAGETTLQVGGGGPQLAGVLGPSSTFVLLGWLDPGDASPELSARTTAEVLVYFATLAPTLPRYANRRMIELLADSPAVDALSAAIEVATRADPEALTHGAESIRSALQAATARVVPRSDPLLLIAPTDTRSGISVLQANGINRIALENEYRRRANFFVEQVSYVREADGQKVDARVPLAGPVELPPTAGVGGGVIGSFVDLFGGTRAYAPVYSDPVALPMAAGASRTTYQVSQVGAGFSKGEYEKLDVGQKEVQAATMIWTFALDVYVPIVFSILLPIKGGTESNWSHETIWAPVTKADGWNDFVNAFPSIPGLVSQLEANDYAGAISTTVQYLITSKTFQYKTIDWCIARLVQLELDGVVSEAQLSSYTSFVTGLGMVLNAINVVSIGLAVGDEIALLYHLSRSSWADQWTVDVLRPKIFFEPEESTIRPAEYVDLEVRVPEGSGGTVGEVSSFTYRYSTTGLSGILKDSVGHSGTSFDSSRNTVTYFALEAEGDDAVTVEVFEIDGAERIPLGRATATVKVGEHAIRLSPGDSSIRPGASQPLVVTVAPEPEDATLSYHYSCAATSGDLLSPAGEVNDFVTDSPFVTYVARTEGDARDQIRVEVEKVAASGRTPIGHAVAHVSVAPYVLSVTPRLANLTTSDELTITATVTPSPADDLAVTYRFRTIGAHGHLDGGDDRTTASPTATYRASSPGHEDVVAELYVTKGGDRKLAGRDVCRVSVEGKRPVRLNGYGVGDFPSPPLPSWVPDFGEISIPLGVSEWPDPEDPWRVVFVWKKEGAGRLIDPSSLAEDEFETQQQHARFVADSRGEVRLSVSAYKVHLPSGERALMGSDSGTLYSGGQASLELVPACEGFALMPLSRGAAAMSVEMGAQYPGGHVYLLCGGAGVVMTSPPLTELFDGSAGGCEFVMPWHASGGVVWVRQEAVRADGARALIFDRVCSVSPPPGISRYMSAELWEEPNEADPAYIGVYVGYRGTNPAPNSTVFVKYHDPAHPNDSLPAAFLDGRFSSGDDSTFVDRVGGRMIAVDDTVARQAIEDFFYAVRTVEAYYLFTE